MAIRSVGALAMLTVTVPGRSAKRKVLRTSGQPVVPAVGCWREGRPAVPG